MTVLMFEKDGTRLSLVQFCSLLVIFINNIIRCVSKNDSDVAHYNINAHELIMVICVNDVAERRRYQMVICHPNSFN